MEEKKHEHKSTPPEVETRSANIAESLIPAEPVAPAPSIMIPAAIVIAGMLIAGAILWSSGKAPAPIPGTPAAKLKKGTISADVGLDKKKFAACLTDRRYQATVQASLEAGVKNGIQGTPFSVVIAKNGAMLEINGAQTAENVKKVIELALTGTSITGTNSNTGKPLTADPITEKDHILGNPNADVKIVTYSDFECPFCKRFHTTMLEVMKGYEKEGKVAWIIRAFPLISIHDKAPFEAEAAECAAEIGGNAKYWEYVNLLEEITPANNGLDPALL